ncbi:hypothetical protein EON63_04385 [archaeon]|nr:MAG: hypothetical protein EON63_04385 [archaeon]
MAHFFIGFLLLVCCYVCSASTTDLESCEVRFHVAFFALHSNLGSFVMRGFMMSSTLNNNPHLCVDARVFTSTHSNLTTFLGNTAAVPVCIFVKDTVADMIVECQKQKALIFLDALDDIATARRLVRYGTQTGPLPKFIYSYLVQSTFLTNELIKRNVSAYYYPHQHGNSIPYKTLRDVTHSSPLVVGFMAGTIKNVPDMQSVILKGLCSLQDVEFHVVNQNIHSVVCSNTTTASSVSSSVTVYTCAKDVNGNYMNSTLTTYTHTNRPNDFCHQDAFYLDKALSAADVGLVWTDHIITPSNVWDLSMLRPPTRMLHWMSRGVPVVYFPTHSYVDVARLNGYETGLDFLLEAHDSDTLALAIKRLRDEKLRRLLSDRALKIAAKHTIERTAGLLTDIFVQHAAGCVCSHRKVSFAPCGNRQIDDVLCSKLELLTLQLRQRNSSKVDRI